MVGMTFLPVVQRELSELSRRSSIYWTRAGVALMAIVAMAWIALVGSGGGAVSQQGLLLFNTISQGAFFVCLLAGVRVTADALSEEKREGTLGLLFLTDLKGYDVVLGKLVSRSATAFYCGLALAPTLALAILLGGTDWQMLVLRLVCLLNTLFLSLAVGMLVSTFSQHERAAMAATLGIIFAIAAGPYIVAGYHAYTLELRDAMLPGFLIYSPVYAVFVTGQRPFTRIFIEEYWLSIAFTHLLGWLCLVISSACIAARAHAERPLGAVAAAIRNFRQRISYGREHQRIAARRALLDRNAFSWLASRDRLKRRYPWIFLGLFGALWGYFYYKAPEVMFDLPIILTVVWFVHAFLKVWAASEVAARFIEDRRSNALELLLTTPLNENEIAAGQRQALLKQFGGPLLLLIAINIVAAFTTKRTFGYGLSTEYSVAMFGSGLIVLLADLYAIPWVAMWRSLHLRGTNRTILQTTVLVIIVPIFIFWLLFQASWLLAVTLRIPPLSWSNAAWPWAIFCVAYDAALVALARRGFYKHFRQRATEAFDAPRGPKTKAKKAVVEVGRVPLLRQLRVRIALSLLLLAGIILGIASIRREQIQSRVERAISRAGLRGEPRNRTELNAWRAAAMPHESALPLLTAAHRQLVKPQSWGSLVVLDRRLGQAPDARELRAFVASNRLFFATMAELADRKSGLGEDSAAALRFNMLGDVMQALRLRGMLAMEDRSAPGMTESITQLLHYARVLEGQITLMNNRSQTLDSLFVLVAAAARDHEIPAEQWREWREILARIENLTELRRRLAAIRVEGLDFFEMPAEALWQRFGRALSPFPSFFAATMGIRRMVGQHDAEKLEFLEMIERFQASTTNGYTAAQRSFQRQWTGPALASREIILPHVTPSFHWLLSAALGAEARTVVLRTVCDIENLRRTTGSVPEEGVFAADPYDRKSLRFRKLENGYIVYSVGENLQDDIHVPPVRGKRLDIALEIDLKE